MNLDFYWIDAFSDRPFAGNPAGVVPLERWLPDALMQRIAAENGLSETAFFVQTAPDRRRPEAGDDERCDRAFADLDRLVQSFGSLLPNDAYYAALFNAYYREVVYNRCVDEPW